MCSDVNGGSSRLEINGGLVENKGCSSIIKQVMGEIFKQVEGADETTKTEK